MKQACYNCERNDVKLNELFGYSVCDQCEKELRLFQDKTIQQHLAKYSILLKQDPKHITYEKEIQRRLDFIDKDYISKRIKLLHVLDRLQNM